MKGNRVSNWLYRHVPMAFGVQARLTLWFILVAVGAVLVGGAVVYFTGLRSIQGTLGQTYCQIASRVVDQFENEIQKASGFVGRIAIDALTTEVAIDADSIYKTRPAAWREARLKRLDREWRQSGPAGRKRILRGQLSHRLTVLANLHPESVLRLALYDHAGLALAASDTTLERVAISENWFRKTRAQERHFTYLELMKKSGRLRIVTPVWGGVSIVGFVEGVYRFDSFANVVEDVRFGRTGEAVVVDYAGVPLTGAPRRDLIQAMAGQAKERQAGQPDWKAVSAREEQLPLWQQLVCVAPVPAVNKRRERFDQPPWSVAVTQSPVESYAALRQSLGFFALVGLMGVIVAGAGGAFMAWRIAAPIRRLRRDVHMFAQGNRTLAAKVSSRDEVGELAAEFNQMAARVRASETELRIFAQAVENAGDAILMTDPRGRIYYANTAFATITGYQLDDVRDKDPALLRSPRTEAHVFGEMRRAMAEGEVWRGEIWNRRKSGEDYPVDLTLSPIRDEDGDVMAFIGIHRDISLAHEYQEKLEREVEARTREIRETQALAVTGRMASMIAHDLRNALSTVKMNLQLLLRRHPDKADVENEHCTMGLDQVQYMEEILRDMLSYARPGKMQGGWHDIPKLIDEALATVLLAARDNGVVIHHEVNGRLPKVYCDRVKVLQILRNLIQNAIMAMPGGGDLDVAVKMTLVDTDPQIIITVSDTGEGIADDILAEVQEPFFTTRARGTGLGLAIVRRLVGLHGGDIHIRSTLGKGTDVDIILPTSQAQDTGKDRRSMRINET